MVHRRQQLLFLADWVAAVLTVLFLTAPILSAASGAPEVVIVNHGGRSVRAIAGEVLIRFRPDVGEAGRLRIAASLGLQERMFFPFAPIGAYTILNGASIETVIRSAVEVDGVADAGPSAAVDYAPPSGLPRIAPTSTPAHAISPTPRLQLSGIPLLWH